MYREITTKTELFAVIDKISTSKTASSLIGSDIFYVVDWIEKTHDVLSKGVHDLKNPPEYGDARRGILHTYLLLGDVASAIGSLNQLDS